MVNAVPTSPLPPRAGDGALPPLRAGDILTARVTGSGQDGTTRLAIGKAPVDLRLPVKVEAGTTIQLRVESVGSEPKLALLVDSSGKPVPPPQAGPGQTSQGTAPQAPAGGLPGGSAGASPAAPSGTTAAAATSTSAASLQDAALAAVRTGASGRTLPIVTATVIGRLPDGRTSLETQPARVTLTTSTSRPEGSAVRLTVEPQPDAVRIRIADPVLGGARPADGSAASSRGAGQAGSIASSSNTIGGGGPAQPAVSPSAPTTSGLVPQAPGGSATSASSPVLQGGGPAQSSPASSAASPGSQGLPANGSAPVRGGLQGGAATSVAATGAGVSGPSISVGAGPPTTSAFGHTVAPATPGAGTATGAVAASNVANPTGVAGSPVSSGTSQPAGQTPQPSVAEGRVVSRAPGGVVSVDLPSLRADLRLAGAPPNGATVRLAAQPDAGGVRLVPLAEPVLQRLTPTPVPLTAVRGLGAVAAGDVLSAQLGAVKPDGTVAVTAGKASFEFRLPPTTAQTLQPGTTLRLDVTSGGTPPQVSVSRPMSTPPTQAAAGQSSAMATASSATAASVSRLPAETARLLAEVAELARPLAATRQDSMAPLFANLQAVSQAGGNGLPDTVTKVMQDLLGFRLTPEQASTPKGLRTAAQASGTLHEAVLARAGTQGAGQTALAGADMKSVLLQMRSALVSFLGKETMLASRKGAGHAPPAAGSLPRGQAASLPTIPPGTTPRETARALLSDTDAALSRLRLSQLASRPGAEQGVRPIQAASGQEWSFEIPIASGTQTSIVQFQVSRDQTGPADAEGGGWNLRFSVDLPETGAIDTLLALRGGSVGITMWAENAGTASDLRADEELLRLAFADSGLETTRIDIRTGRPTDQARKAGYFVDWRT